MFKKTPAHNWASHGADAWRCLSNSWRTPPREEEPEPKAAFRLMQDLTIGEFVEFEDEPMRGATHLSTLACADAPARRPMILVPFNRRETISLREAAKVAGRCESTVRGWCGAYDIGRRIGNGPWQVSRVALAMFLDGAEDALRAYLAGDRTGELVEGYFAQITSQPSP